MSGWTHEQVLKLIEEVRKRPCLYDYKHPFYKSRSARQEMLQECQAALKPIRSNISIEDVKKKWSAIRQTYIVEKRKEENSLKSGVRSELLYTPSLFYYKEMAFLKDLVELRSSEFAHNFEDDTDSPHGIFGMSPEGSLVMEESSHAFSEPAPLREETDHVLGEPRPSSSSKKSSKSNKRRRLELDDTEESFSGSMGDTLLSASSAALLNTLHSLTSTEKAEDSEDRYGKTVADRLRAFSEREQILIKKRIDDLLYDAYLKKVDR